MSPFSRSHVLTFLFLYSPLGLLLLSGCPETGPIDPGGPAGPGITVLTIIPDANAPTAITSTPDGRILYTEKPTGQLRVLTSDGQLLPDPLVTVPVVVNEERGLLGIALHPNFPANGWLYLFYTRSATGQLSTNQDDAVDNRVVRFTVSGNTAAGPETLILSLPAGPDYNHNAGHMAFGPDGKLYVSIGDVGSGNEPQDPNDLRGRIHRINDDGSIPPDNPFGPANSTFALGLRNTFGIAFDPVSGVLFGADNGTNVHDEINRVVAGGNYGWPLVEGFVSTPPAVTAGTYVNPILDWAFPTVAPTGVVFAPDATFGPQVQDTLLVGEYKTGRIYSYTLDDARQNITGSTLFAQGISNGITDMTFAPDGTLYLITQNAVLHIVPH